MINFYYLCCVNQVIMERNIRTRKGYDFYEAASALQKSIRRAKVREAAYFGVELWSSGYGRYVWKRLFTISAEDCYGIITKEIEALYHGYYLVNDGQKDPKGRVFIAKAIILLCEARKSRDADHLNNLVVDKISYDDAEIQALLKEEEYDHIPVPLYTYDVHTRRGKIMGKTKKDFFREELEALCPREIGMFDELV